MTNKESNAIHDQLESERARAYQYAFPTARDQGHDSLESRQQFVGGYVRHVLQVAKEHPEILKLYHLQAALDIAHDAKDLNLREEAATLKPMVAKLEEEILREDVRGKPAPNEVGWIGKLVFGFFAGLLGYGIHRSTKKRT